MQILSSKPTHNGEPYKQDVEAGCGPHILAQVEYRGNPFKEGQAKTAAEKEALDVHTDVHSTFSPAVVRPSRAP